MCLHYYSAFFSEGTCTHLQKLFILFSKIHYYIDLFFSQNIKFCKTSKFWNLIFAVLTIICSITYSVFEQKKQKLHVMISFFLISFFLVFFLLAVNCKKKTKDITFKQMISLFFWMFFGHFWHKMILSSEWKTHKLIRGNTIPFRLWLFF